MSHATYFPGVNLSATYDGADPTCSEVRAQPHGSISWVNLHASTTSICSCMAAYANESKLLHTGFPKGFEPIEDSPRGWRTADRTRG